MPDSRWYPPAEDVKQRLITAVCMLYRHDRDLLGVNANERSITHKLAEHLQREFPNWHVDCEYNRRRDAIKRLQISFEEISADDIEAKTVFPDIIVHRRRTEQNLLVLEVKKDNGRENTQDIKKLQAFTTVPKYQYQYGLFLRLGTTGATIFQLYQLGGRQYDWTGDLTQALQELGYGE
jgi:hypothetical protein